VFLASGEKTNEVSVFSLEGGIGRAHRVRLNLKKVIRAKTENDGKS